MTVVEGKVIEKVNELEERLVAATPNPFKGKWISILGDSISTYEGYIPSGNNTYYPSGDVDDVSKTWWHKLLTKLGAKLCVNESYGGSRIYDSTETSGALQRYTNLYRKKGQEYRNLDGTKEVATEDIYPDYIIIMMGINDFINNVELGEFSPYTVASTTTNVIDCYETIIFSIIVSSSEYAKHGANLIIMDTLCAEINGRFGMIEKNSATVPYSQYDLNETIEKLAKKWRIPHINVDQIGVHGGNNGLYTFDHIHPNTVYMEKLANQCYKEMIASNCL